MSRKHVPDPGDRFGLAMQAHGVWPRGVAVLALTDALLVLQCLAETGHPEAKPVLDLVRAKRDGYMAFYRQRP